MIELLMHGGARRRRERLGRTLEIGTGCGYQAALLARLSRQVLSIERLKPCTTRRARTSRPCA